MGAESSKKSEIERRLDAAKARKAAKAAWEKQTGRRDDERPRDTAWTYEKAPKVSGQGPMSRTDNAEYVLTKKEPRKPPEPRPYVPLLYPCEAGQRRKLRKQWWIDGDRFQSTKGLESVPKGSEFLLVRRATLKRGSRSSSFAGWLVDLDGRQLTAFEVDLERYSRPVTSP